MSRAITITPVLRYQDASAAASWLCEAFGFQEHDRAQELDGHVRFISLRLGDSFALVRPVASSVFDDLMVQPEAIGGGNTQVCYLTVADTDAHRARAHAAGARIELEPQDDGLGGRFYTCRDVEGHLWSFGTRTYGIAHEARGAFAPTEIGPQQASTDIPIEMDAAKAAPPSVRASRTAIATTSVLIAVAGWLIYGSYTGGTAKNEAVAGVAAARLEETLDELTSERARRLAAETASKQAMATLAEAQSGVDDLRLRLQQADARLASARQAKASEDAEAAQQRLEAELSEARRARAEAEVAVASARQLVEAELAKTRQQADEELGKQARMAADVEARLAAQEQAALADKRELLAALQAAERHIEELRAGQLEPMLADESAAESSPCVLAVQGKIPSGPKGSNTWTATNLSRLCRGAEASVEPARCFEEITRGKINWGGGTTWATPNVLALCGGTRSARKTIDCFTKLVASNQTWQEAIKQCRTQQAQQPASPTAGK